jgi:hypothetical protein
MNVEISEAMPFQFWEYLLQIFSTLRHSQMISNKTDDHT